MMMVWIITGSWKQQREGSRSGTRKLRMVCAFIFNTRHCSLLLIVDLYH
jgi:hypothetical protein